MTMKIFVASVLLLASYSFQRDLCSKEEYSRCVKIADPLVKEARLIFPDRAEDIEVVCGMWNDFVDCLKRYTDRCFTEQQRRQFNKAVENPIESVHQMCTQPRYQSEYLRHASCIKSTITDRYHCGPDYSRLVDQVEQSGDAASKEALCCTHDRFKQCVSRETRRVCDRGVVDGPASRFSSQIVDKALSFLQDQCYNYIPNSGECSGYSTDGAISYSDPLMISTSPGDVRPWSNVQDPASKQALPERPPSSVSWFPSFGSSTSSDPQPQSTPVQQLGERTRPSTYGRSGNWGESTSQPNTITAHPDTVPETSSSSANKQEWATVTTWHVMGGQSPADPYLSTKTGDSSGASTTWYPSPGSQSSNEVDEPNQQGLIKPKNGAVVKKGAILSITVVATVLTAFC